jgi:acetyl esterase/lipase
MTESDAPSVPPKRRPSPAEMVRMPVVYRLPGVDAVVVRKNVAYRTLENVDLEMDLYAPPGAEQGGERPAVVFVHGGPIPAPPVLQPKEWRDYHDFGCLAAASGYVGVTFNHRFYGLDRAPDAMGDVEELIRFVRQGSRDLGIDAGRLALWAFSGGGVFLTGPIRRPLHFIRGLVGFYTVMDLRSFPGADSSRVSGGGRLAHLSAVAALEEASGPIPPILIGRAGLDLAPVNGSIDRFVESALRKNVDLTLRNHPAGEHGFDILNDDDVSRDIIRHAFDFLHRVLR